MASNREKLPPQRRKDQEENTNTVHSIIKVMEEERKRMQENARNKRRDQRREERDGNHPSDTKGIYIPITLHYTKKGHGQGEFYWNGHSSLSLVIMPIRAWSMKERERE